MAYFIGKFPFVHKGAARQEVRRILHSHRAGYTLKKNDFELIASLVAMHPEAERKIGPGIRSISVGPRWRWNWATRKHDLKTAEFCFWVHRLDGTRATFSYKKCFTEEKVVLDEARP